MGFREWYSELKKRRALRGVTHAHCMEGLVDGKVEYRLFRLWDGKISEYCWGAPKRYGTLSSRGSAHAEQALEHIRQEHAYWTVRGFVDVAVPEWWSAGDRPPEAEGPDFFEDPDFHEIDGEKVKEVDTWTHSGMYLLWLDANGMFVAPGDEDDLANLMRARQRQMTPGAYFGDAHGGWFGPDDLTDEGLAFTRSYYTDKGYKADYRAHVLKPRSNFYSSADTWETYELIAPVLDERFAAWKEAQQLK